MKGNSYFLLIHGNLVIIFLGWGGVFFNFDVNKRILTYTKKHSSEKKESRLERFFKENKKRKKKA
jgi:glucokinase